MSKRQSEMARRFGDMFFHGQMNSKDSSPIDGGGRNGKQRESLTDNKAGGDGKDESVVAVKSVSSDGVKKVSVGHASSRELKHLRSELRNEILARHNSGFQKNPDYVITASGSDEFSSIRKGSGYDDYDISSQPVTDSKSWKNKAVRKQYMRHSHRFEN